jgi:hypothetical protein
VFPVGIGLRDPRSQTRDPTARRGRLGHPSVSPFDIAGDKGAVRLVRDRFNASILRRTKERVRSMESGLSGLFVAVSIFG